METLLQKSLKTFYQDIAEECYWAYYYDKGNISAEDVAELYLPLCKIVAVSKFYWVPETAWEDMFSEAYVEIYRCVVEKRCKANAYAFFFGLIKNTLNTKASHYMHFYSSRETHDGSITIKSPFLQHKDVNHQLFLQDLPKIIRHIVLSNIRFTGNEYQACRYILNRFLMNRRVVYFVLENRYHIKKEMFKFFEDYVIVLYRDALFSIKRDLTFTVEDDGYCVPTRGYIDEDFHLW